MKIEQKQLLGFLGKCAILIIFAALYAIGGSGDFWGGQKWIRRFLAPAILCLYGVIVSRGDWRSYAFYPLMAGALTLPYGADAFWMKFLLRGVDGIAYGVAFNLYNYFNYRFIVAIYGCILTVAASIVFGVFNPWPNPIIEQGLIGICICLTYVFNVRKK